MVVILMSAGFFSQVLAVDLINHSPFLPPANSAVATATQNAPGSLELRSVARIGDTFSFSIFDPTRKNGSWVKLHEKGDGFEVTNYDAENEVATVETQGRTLKINLQQAKTGSSPAPNYVPPQPPPPQVLPGQAPQNPVVLNPSAGDEQKRLEAVAEEIRRRRAMRQSANSQPEATPK